MLAGHCPKGPGQWSLAAPRWEWLLSHIADEKTKAQWRNWDLSSYLFPPYYYPVLLVGAGSLSSWALG